MSDMAVPRMLEPSSGDLRKYVPPPTAHWTPTTRDRLEIVLSEAATATKLRFSTRDWCKFCELVGDALCPEPAMTAPAPNVPKPPAAAVPAPRELTNYSREPSDETPHSPLTEW